MSLEPSYISSQGFEGSSLALEILAQSRQLTPFRQLDSVDSAMSSYEPKVLIFSGNGKRPQLDTKLQSIDLLYGSRLYQSFSVQMQNENAEIEAIKQHYRQGQEFSECHVNRSDQSYLLQQSEQIFYSKQIKIELKRQQSVDFFASQLEQLKSHINKLVTLSKVDHPNNSIAIDSFNVQDPQKIFKSRISQQAKSTQSQQYNTDSPKQKVQISKFEINDKFGHNFGDISPIALKQYSISHYSSNMNVNMNSTRDLMKKKTLLRSKLIHRTA